MSGRGLKPALPRLAADVRSRAKARATQVRGGCQVAGYRPALQGIERYFQKLSQTTRRPFTT